MAFVPTESSRQSAIRAAACAAALALLHIAWLVILGHRLAAIAPQFHRQGLPFAIVGLPSFPLGLGTELALVAIAFLESAVLYLTYRTFSATLQPRAAPLLIGVACIVMLGVSLRPAFVAADAYYYVLYAKTPTLASTYRPATLAFEPGFEPLQTVLTERPLLPSVYGPVWQLLDRAAVGRAATLRDALVSVRLLSVVWLVVFIAMVLLLDVAVSLKAMIVLNPALYYLYVVDAHNDIVPLATLAAGLVLLNRKYPAAAAVCGAIAGAMKISFIVVAIATLATRGSLRMRAAIALGIALGAALISYALGGNPYIHAMVSVGTKQGAVERSHFAHAFRLVVQSAALLTAVAAAFAAIFYRRLIAWASFAFPAVSGLVHSWYFPWALPYAVRAKETLVPLAVALPLLTLFTDPGLTSAFHFQFTSLILALAVALAIWQTVKNRSLIAIERE